MRYLLTAFILFYGSTLIASDEIKVNKSALQLEEQYLELANTLSHARNQSKKGCDGEVEARLQDIMHLVREAKFYFDKNKNYNKSEKREFDPVLNILKAVKHTVSIRELLGLLPFDNPNLFANELQGSVLWGPAPGAYENMSMISFISSTEYKIHKRAYSPSGKSIWTEKTGTFNVSTFTSQSMKVSLNREGLHPLDFQLKRYGNEPNRMWVLIPFQELSQDSHKVSFVEFPRECGL